MNLDNFSKAFGSLVKNDSSWLKINDNFSILVGRLSVESQSYNARASDWTKEHKDIVTSAMFDDLVSTKKTEDTASFTAHVLMIDWKLKDNDGKEIPFTPEQAVEILNHPVLGTPLFIKVSQYAMIGENFNADWEEKIVKNS